MTPVLVLEMALALTGLVFFHELGHYLVARWNGVRIEVFSIGFGPELFGWNDRAGTRWKFGAIPLGGYVKMFGDADAASMPGAEVPSMSEAEKRVSFHHKRLWQRAAIVAAGPIANFILAILLLAIIFAVYGRTYVAPTIGFVLEDSAAAHAGLKIGDVVTKIDGQSIESFGDIPQIVALNTGTPLDITLRRGGETIDLSVTPKIVIETDRLGLNTPLRNWGFSLSRLRWSGTSAISTAARRSPQQRRRASRPMTWSLRWTVGRLPAFSNTPTIFSRTLPVRRST